MRRHLTDTCSLVTVEKVSDGKGGFTNSTSGVSTSCSAASTGSQLELVVAEQVEGRTVMTIEVPWSTTVSQDDIIEKDGTTYRVQHIPGDDSRALLKQVIVSK